MQAHQEAQSYGELVVDSLHPFQRHLHCEVVSWIPGYKAPFGRLAHLALVRPIEALRATSKHSIELLAQGLSNQRARIVTVQ